MSNAPHASIRHGESVPANVRAEIARSGRSQAEIAVALGLAQTGVSRRLTGRIDFSASELTKLASLLNVPVSTFFGEVAIAPASSTPSPSPTDGEGVPVVEQVSA